jgi:hypothetical protein
MRELNIIKKLAGIMEYKVDVSSDDSSNNELNTFLKSPAYQRSVDIIKSGAYHGYTNQEIDKVFKDSSM